MIHPLRPINAFPLKANHQGRVTYRSKIPSRYALRACKIEIPLNERALHVGKNEPWPLIQEVYGLQRATEFFQIVERGNNTISYGISMKDEPPKLVEGSERSNFLGKASLIFISNLDRSKRPSKKQGNGISERVNPDDPAMRFIDPERIMANNKDQYWMEWIAPSAKRWWFLYNPFAIWPPIEGKPAEEQPHHLTFSRGDSKTMQDEMHRFENLWDVVSGLLKTNNSIDRGQCLFRGGVNGWYYGNSKKAVKAGATQSNAHAQFVRFPFPLELAELQVQKEIDHVRISTIADGMGTGYVLETPVENAEKATRWAAKILEHVIARDNSFNVLIAPGKENTVRLFLADRERGVPRPHFTNEFGFSEFGRAIVVDVLHKFYQMDPVTLREWETVPPDHQKEWLAAKKIAGSLGQINPDLAYEAFAALNMVTAPQHQLDRVISQL